MVDIDYWPWRSVNYILIIIYYKWPWGVISLYFLFYTLIGQFNPTQSFAYKQIINYPQLFPLMVVIGSNPVISRYLEIFINYIEDICSFFIYHMEDVLFFYMVILPLVYKQNVLSSCVIAQKIRFVYIQIALNIINEQNCWAICI